MSESVDPNSALMYEVLEWRTSRGAYIAAIVIFFYDYILTFNREVFTVWNARKGLGSILFLLARYATFVDIPLYSLWLWPRSINFSTCRALFILTNVFAPLSIAASDGILCLTLYALLGAKKKHKTLLSVFYAVNIVLAFILITFFLLQSKVSTGLWSIPDPWNTGLTCFVEEPSTDWRLINYVFLLVAEVFLTGFALWFGWTKYRQSNSPLVTILFGDGIMYYVIILCFTIINIIAPHTIAFAGGNFFAHLQRVMHPILACRLIFDLREKSRCPFTLEESSPEPISAIRFGSNAGVQSNSTSLPNNGLRSTTTAHAEATGGV